MSWVADTSWLYALVNDSDPHHGEARDQAKDPEPVEVPQPILGETLDLIRYRHGPKAAREALEGFERLPHLALGESVAHAAVVAVWREHDALSYADAAAVAAAVRGALGLRSFDRRQLRAFKQSRAK